MNNNVIDNYSYLRNQLQETLEAWDDIRNDDIESFYYPLIERLDKMDSFKLYHYAPANLRNIRNLEKQTIYLTENGNFNDIYEGVPSFQVHRLTHEDLKFLSDIANITCFSETYNNLLMWSHYADSHKGLCIEYDLKEIDKESDLLKHIFPIVYQQKRNIDVDIHFIVDRVKELNEAIYQCGDFDLEQLDCVLPLFVTKGMAWSYEKEWRVIYTKLDAYKDENFSRSIPFDCITGIYLGHRIEETEKEIILEVAERLSKKCNRHIFVYESNLSNDEYELEFEKIV